MTGGLDATPRVPAAGRELVPALLNLVRFQHTVFALPFAVSGALLARHGWPHAAVLLWVLVAMVGARSLAMAVNRLVDARIDAANPRTAGRELPSGRLTPQQVWWFSAASLAMLLLAVSRLPRITWWLWPIPVAGFVLYPYTKRFTWLCHLVLGLVIGLAPVGGWIAVTGHFAWAPVLLGLAVACWIGGFDVIYALLDLEFDRAHGVRSVPVRFGPAGALWITRGMHALAVLLLVAAGEAAGVGWWYRLGVAVCAGILVFENLHVHPEDRGRIQAAFGRANALLALAFIVLVVLEVSVPSPL